MSEKAKVVGDCTDGFTVEIVVFEHRSIKCLNSCSHHMVQDTSKVISDFDYQSVESVTEPMVSKSVLWN